MFALSDAREYSFSQVPYLQREEIHAKFSSGDGSSFEKNWLTTRAKTKSSQFKGHVATFGQLFRLRESHATRVSKYGQNEYVRALNASYTFQPLMGFCFNLIVSIASYCFPPRQNYPQQNKETCIGYNQYVQYQSDSSNAYL